MKSGISVFSLGVFLVSSIASADTPLIRTTVADSSRVAFIAQTPLSWERAVHDTLDFIRFTDSPLTDSVGYPELPVISCLVAVPDSVTPTIEYSVTDELMQRINPVYPSPAFVLVSDSSTAMFADSFVQDSAAYASTSFWPAERVCLAGETRLCDQRLLKILLYPAQYRAADSTLSTVSSFSLCVSFDSSEAVWSNIGLGELQRFVFGSPIVGYHEIEQTHALVPRNLGVVNPRTGPASPYDRMPDYVIICASGLYADCTDAIENLADHRVSTSGLDVAVVLTDAILDEFGDENQDYITDETIRAFTQHMWENWPQASVKKPDYMLLIGDHEEGSSYGSADWFLPTHVYSDYISQVLVHGFGNDEWYAYMNGNPEIKNDFPSFAVGRLSVKNGESQQTDTLTAMINNIIALEQPISTPPVTDNRRSILRLAGTGDRTDTYCQVYKDWGPERATTSTFCDWLGYNYRDHYCGDGRNFSSDDGSILSSEDFRDYCIDELKTGAGVAFYTNHGELHMFSAGLEWCEDYYTAGDVTKGCRDSTFNNYQIENQLTSTNQFYSAPFMLMLCCSAGTFNHTLHDHETRTSHTYFCHWEQTPVCDFGSDCLAEKLLKNTAVPVAGVFAASMPSGIDLYRPYGYGILKAVYRFGFGRTGDAIASARAQYEGNFMFGGLGIVSLGQYNLLGDPALDISDRVRYPNKCDLVVYPDDITVGYPVETASGFDLPVQFTVRNNGHMSSGAYDCRIIFSDGQSVNTRTVSCSTLRAGGFDTVEYTWQCTSGFTPPREITVSVEADYQVACTDSWRGNNAGEISFQLNDVYPIESGWPVETTGIVQTTPMLVNLDQDSELEVVVLAGPVLTAYDIGQTVSVLWSLGGEGFVGQRQPLAADLDQDGDIEFLLASINDEIKVVSNSGSLLYTLSNASSVFAVGNMHQRSGLELCAASADGNYLRLYYWDNSGMNLISTKDFDYTGIRSPVSLSIASVTGSSYDDAVYFNGGTSASFPEEEEKTSVEIYNWGTSTLEYSDTWNEYVNGNIRLTAGVLSGIGSVGFPQGVYDTTSDPAQIIEPDEGTPEISCSNTNVQQATNLNCGVFADWVAGSGADTFVLPSEKQCMAWDVVGDPISGFPTALSGSQQGSVVSPAALGNINASSYADVFFSTVLNEDCNIVGYSQTGNPLSASGFPYILPEDVSTGGGIAIGDLDRDGKVEIVFGSNDCMLHCWEFGSCTTGYLPWPQYQHDCGRTGVLE